MMLSLIHYYLLFLEVIVIILAASAGRAAADDLSLFVDDEDFDDQFGTNLIFSLGESEVECSMLS